MARTIRVISSPSKHMDAVAPTGPWSPMTQPIFADGAQLLVDRMRSMSFEVLEAPTACCARATPSCPTGWNTTWS